MPQDGHRRSSASGGGIGIGGIGRLSLSLSRTRSLEIASRSPLVAASLARDLDEEPAGEDATPLDSAAESEGSGDESDSEDGGTIPRWDMGPEHAHDLAGSFRRQSIFAAAAAGRAYMPDMHDDERLPTAEERHQAWREERSLLRDNNIIPPKHPRQAKSYDTLGARVARRASKMGLGVPGGDRPVIDRDGRAQPPTEASPLLPPVQGDPEQPYGGLNAGEEMSRKWEAAVAAGKIHTSWQRETKVLLRYTAPLIFTTLLQYSLTVASIFAVSRLGTVELGAVSLASMSANITGYVIYAGMATSLDTLCAQAFGSGHKRLVGLQAQRMAFFLWACTIPIGAIWLASPWILSKIVPDPRTAELAGLYLRVALIGAPGYAAFEAGKRFVQAQGLFSVPLYVLLFCAPLNALLNWLFVWQLGWGFVGAPIAVALVDNLLPILLVIYVRFGRARQCWPGLTRRALHNWGPMIRLALPGLVMVEAECLAFEVLTLMAAYFGTEALAAQTILATAANLTWQIPFPLSIATSTRVANLIGASLPDAAKVTARVAGVLGVIVGLFNFALLSGLRGRIAILFSDDPVVIAIVERVMPVCAAFQLFDSLAAVCNGLLRGMGRQVVGGYVQLFCYYVVAMPISVGTAFGAGWDLSGLWTGVAVALALVTVIEALFIRAASWERSVRDAQQRIAGA